MNTQHIFRNCQKSKNIGVSSRKFSCLLIDVHNHIRNLTLLLFGDIDVTTPDIVTERQDFIEVCNQSIPEYLSFDLEDYLEPCDILPTSPKRNMTSNMSNAHELIDTTTSPDIASFVFMIRSPSDKIKLEAVSALLHFLSMNYADTGKLFQKFHVFGVEIYKYSHSSISQYHVKLLNVGRSIFSWKLFKIPSSRASVMNVSSVWIRLLVPRLTTEIA